MWNILVNCVVVQKLKEVPASRNLQRYYRMRSIFYYSFELNSVVINKLEEETGNWKNKTALQCTSSNKQFAHKCSENCL
jgi:hypothetical protein